MTTLPPSCAVVMKSGNLNFLEPSGPLQACNGTALSLPLPYMLAVTGIFRDMKCRRRQYRENKIEIETMSFESVQSFKYLGSTVNQNNTIEEEFKERLIAGNRAYSANQKMFQSKLLSRKSKLKLYWTLIRPVAVYACETWVLKENSIQKLMIYERKILRKIFGPTKEPNGL